MARGKKTTIDTLGRTVPVSRRGWGKTDRQKSGNYRASYIGPDGNRYCAPHTFTTKGDAEGWLARVRDDIRREVWRSPTELQAEHLGVYAPAWLEQRRTRKGDPLRQRTREMYTDVITRGLYSLSTTPISQLTPVVVRQWHARRTREAGATQAGLEARILRAILNTAVRDELIARCPVPPELCVTRSGNTYRAPTDQELAALIEAMPENLRLAVQLAAFGGLRLSEWRALRRSDLTRAPSGHWLVNVERQALRVDGKWIVTAPKSEEGIRTSALPAWLSADIEAHLAKYVGEEPDALLFQPAGKGGKVGEFVDMSWRRAWSAARKEVGLGLEVRSHDLRHYYGTTLAESGATALQLRSAMGHASIQTSMIYVDAAHGATPEVADLLVKPMTSSPGDSDRDAIGSLA